MRDVLSRSDNESFNAVAHLLLELDAEERLKFRRRQTLQLARYGHAGRPDECMGWGDVLVAEMDRLYEELADILNGEGPAGATET